MTFKELFTPSSKKVIVTIIFVVLCEIWIFWIGLHSVFCKICVSSNCPPCVSYGAGAVLALMAIIPSTLIIYFLVCLLSYILVTFVSSLLEKNS